MTLVFIFYSCIIAHSDIEAKMVSLIIFKIAYNAVIKLDAACRFLNDKKSQNHLITPFLVVKF